MGLNAISCYNQRMRKDEATEKDDATAKGQGGKDSNAAAETDKKSGSDDEVSGSASELQPVSSKKGEPADNLRRRSEWFQKRHG